MLRAYSANHKIYNISYMTAVIHKAILSFPELLGHGENQTVLSKLSKQNAQADEFKEGGGLNSWRRYGGTSW